MKFARLVRVNLGRKKRRTILTVLSITVALFLFALLRSVVTTLDDSVEVGSESRLITRSAISIVFPLPQSYYEALRSTPGVAAATWACWFGGNDPAHEREFFAQFAIDADTYLTMYPELQIPGDQKEAFMRERTAAIVGTGLMKKFGWQLGQTVTLKGTIYPGDWPFTIRAVYTPTDPSVGANNLLFHYEYLYEKSGRQAEPGWYVLELSDPSRAAAISEAIDARYRNSSAATKTETEKAFSAGFVTMWGNIRFLLTAIGTAVFFAILSVAGNTMLTASRERIPEIAVLKTLGFRDRLVSGLVLAESLVISIGGGLLGLLAAKLILEGSGFNAMGMLEGFEVKWGTIGTGLLISAILGLVAGLIPAWQAGRLQVIEALRKVA